MEGKSVEYQVVWLQTRTTDLKISVDWGQFGEDPVPEDI
ncbi:hypothetical protein BMS3Bbin04_00433 [bacterium BMS3Bbin04]|nr:hypothetical protein BMS3Bbin04_00433 [bacterium BMS3Bbin04]